MLSCHQTLDMLAYRSPHGHNHQPNSTLNPHDIPLPAIVTEFRLDYMRPVNLPSNLSHQMANTRQILYFDSTRFQKHTLDTSTVHHL